MTGAKPVRAGAKGLVLAHGEREDAYLPVSAEGPVKNQLADVPRIQFTLASMVAAGVDKILISVSPQTLICLKDALKNSAHLPADVSYLLVNPESSLCEVIAESNEFIASCKVLVMDGGVFFAGDLATARLKQAVNIAKGAVWVTARRGFEDQAPKGTCVFVLDKISQNALRLSNTASGDCQTPSGLRNYCIRELKYSETDLGTDVRLVDLMHDILSQDSTISEARNLQFVLQQG